MVWWSTMKRETTNVFTKAFAQQQVERLYKKYREELKTRDIEWYICDETDVLEFNWACYSLEGIDQDGIEYMASGEGFRLDRTVEEVYDIELKD
jgi:hypothetical protein